MSFDPEQGRSGMPYGMQGESFGTEPYGMRGESFPPNEPYGMRGESFDPFGTPPGRRGVSGFAVASFIFGLIGGIPLGLIFGIVALGKIRRTGQRGRGLAIAGLVLTGAWVALFVVIFYAGALHTIRPTPAAAASYNFQAGQCFERAPISQAGVSTPVDCAQPHYGEVFAVENAPWPTYPGQTAVEEFAKGKCPVDVIKALPPGMNHPDISVAFLFPQDKSWAQGDRTIKCFFHRHDDQPMTGLVKDTGVPYTDEQNRYLRVSQPYDAIVRAQDAAVAWPDQHDAAVRAVPVLQKEIDVLKAGPWPADAKAAVDALVAVKQVELADRQQAADATDRGTLLNALSDAHGHSGSDQIDAVRAALHLQPLH
jgi:Domain of unknown function (DUF4190)/Septum formation